MLAHLNGPLSPCVPGPQVSAQDKLDILNENVIQQESLNFPRDFRLEENYASPAGSHGSQECCW